MATTGWASARSAPWQCTARRSVVAMVGAERDEIIVDVGGADPREQRNDVLRIGRILVAPELPVSEARQVERPDPDLMPGELALGLVDDSTVQP